jgi:hypothetical protein
MTGTVQSIPFTLLNTEQLSVRAVVPEGREREVLVYNLANNSYQIFGRTRIHIRCCDLQE